jgi:hypothetical protein
MFTFLHPKFRSPLTSIERGARPSLATSLSPGDINAGTENRRISVHRDRDLKVGSVVIDCNDLATMSGFWQEALRYVPREPPEDAWVVLRDPDGQNVNVSLQVVPEERVGKNRLHLDLYTTDQMGEVERLLALGATRFSRIMRPEEDFIVLEDPEGNLFCVIDKR